MKYESIVVIGIEQSTDELFPIDWPDEANNIDFRNAATFNNNKLVVLVLQPPNLTNRVM